MFNVGDIVSVGDTSTYYEVMEASPSHLKPRVVTGRHTYGWHRNSLFTLVTPSVPPPPVLTGMTQFFKDMKEIKA
jgi:hypothetical protein